ncbi:MAG TPA: sigma 54-interacting transcriptional regulator, partial [Candidatus Eisenbacteria bacterium]|nr:sigma 54-interacting transcriptional regulator [Candidatus Eisenbacteria bacterium]
LYPDESTTGMGSKGVVSYLGMPLIDSDQQVIGQLAVVDTRPMPPEKQFFDLFTIFANRARAEMQRVRLEEELRDGRERLSGLIDSAMDAIVELDAALKITLMNASAERLFGCATESVQGDSVDCIIGSVAMGKLAGLARELEAREGSERYLWIPEGLAAEPSSKSAFHAEATLSRFERGRSPFYTLILRNVEDRLQAERKIQDLTAQTAYLREEIEADHGFTEIVGKSPALYIALRNVVQVASTDASVLIMGETGTGKELFARAIHNRSARRDKPMIKVNCAAIPGSLMESEFFGHEKGAFTGATQRREGRFALADGGTIFLDEVGELPLELQGKLLRVLQEGEFEPVGSSRTRRVNVRVLTATNRDLEAMVKTGDFRQDLYYRLAVFPLFLPPIRERGEDVVLLATTLLDRLGRERGRKAQPLSEADCRALRSYSWPGNVRELRNVIERALITSRDGILRLSELLPGESQNPGAGNGGPSPEPLASEDILNENALRRLERENMIAALERCGWRVGGKDGAAELLGLSPSTLKSRMKTMGVERALTS